MGRFSRGKGCNNRKLSDADRLEIVRLYTTPQADGTWLGASTLAKAFGVRHPTIYRELRRAGVERRTSKEAHSGGKRCRPIVNLPQGQAPLCRCGCGTPTLWNRRKKRWNRYIASHYTQRLDQSNNVCHSQVHGAMRAA
jgi:transposase-like protein